MKIKNQKGIVETAILYGIIAIMGLLYVPNPVSSALGVGVRPNKIVEKQYDKERVELLKDKDGNIVAVKTTSEGGTQNLDQQQKVSLWEQLRALPVLWIILMVLGIFFAPVAAVMRSFNSKVSKQFKTHQTDTAKIVKGLNNAFATVAVTIAGADLPGETDRVALTNKIISAMKAELRDTYNDSTKELVRKIKNT